MIKLVLKNTENFLLFMGTYLLGFFQNDKLNVVLESSSNVLEPQINPTHNRTPLPRCKPSTLVTPSDDSFCFLIVYLCCLNTGTYIYTNGQKKGYTVYMSNYAVVNLKHSSFLT